MRLQKSWQIMPRIQRCLALGVLSLLVPVGLFPSGAAEPAPAWIVEDPVGDQTLLGAAVPSNTLYRHTDLTRFDIQEDEYALTFAWHVDKLRVDDSASCCDEQGRYDLSFEIEGAKAHYQAIVNVMGTIDHNDESTFIAVPKESIAYFGICVEETRCTYAWYLYLQPAVLNLDDATDTISLQVPKTALLAIHDDGDDKPTGLPANVDAGTVLKEVRLASRYYLGETIDDATPEPDAESPPYILQHAAANTRVRFHLQDGDATLGVLPGQATPLVLEISNDAASKRVIDLTYGFRGDPASTAKYAVSGPATVTVPAGETRPVRLELKAEAGAPDGVTFWVHGKSFGPRADAGHAEARLLPSVSLAPGAETLYILARTESESPVCNSPAKNFNGPCSTGFLSAQRDDPAGTGDRVKGWSWMGIPTVGLDFDLELERESPTPVALDAAKPFTLTLKTANSVPIEGVRVAAELYGGTGDDQGTLFSVSQTVDLAADGTVTLEGPAAMLEQGATERIVPAGGRLVLRLEFRATLSPGAYVQEALGGVELVAKESHVKLPLKALPPDVLNAGALSPFQVSVLGDREGYVNPGEARLFNVTVLNQDEVPHGVDLEANSAWTTDLLPGDAFDLGPGESVRLGVLVHAPATAKEGETIEVLVNATTNGGTPAGVKVRAIAVEADVADDADRFTPNAEDVARLAGTPRGSTPGPSLVVVLCTSLVALVRRSRRIRI